MVIVAGKDQRGRGWVGRLLWWGRGVLGLGAHHVYELDVVDHAVIVGLDLREQLLLGLGFGLGRLDLREGCCIGFLIVFSVG